MLKIKLIPGGKKHARYFRIAVVEHRSKLTGRAIANLGSYFPPTGQLRLDTQALTSWVQKGAQPTPAVAKIAKSKP